MQEMGLGTRPKSMKADFGLGYMLGLRQGKSGRKKRMDKAWWKDIQQVPVFDPEPEESDWRLLFRVNAKEVFHPDLTWADSQWSDHATGVGMLAIKAGKISQKTADKLLSGAQFQSFKEGCPPVDQSR